MIHSLVNDFIILTSAVVMLLSDRLRVDLVAPLVGLAPGFNEFLPSQEAFS